MRQRRALADFCLVKELSTMHEALNHQHNELPTNRFDARLSEELEERVEFVKWSATVSGTTANGGSVSGSATISSS